MNRTLRSAVAIVFALVVCWPVLARADDEPSVLVRTVRLQTGSVPPTILAYGTVQADASAQRAIMAPTSATVAAIHVRIGQEVPKGAPLIELEPNPQTRADYARARSGLENATTQLQRTRQLYKEYLATRQQLSDAEKALTDAQAALQALQAQGAGGAKTITAPFRAIVTKLDTSTGSLVTEGTSLLELSPPGRLVLRVGVVPAQAAQIRVGDAGTVRPIAEQQTFAATVTLSGSAVDLANGLVPVELALPPNSFLPGQAAEARIATAAVRGYVVPHAAILIDDSGRPYVVQVIGDAARLVTVRILESGHGQDVITGKLDPAAPLVVSGNHQLTNGMKVRLSNSPAPGH